jgi:shikimate 5-dehydrogenase
MRIALLGTGFGQAHAAVYAARPDVDEVVVFGRTPQKLAQITEEFGFATTTDLTAVLTNASVDLVDVCLPTRLHADVAVRAMQAGRDVLIELPLDQHMSRGNRRAVLMLGYRVTASARVAGGAVHDRSVGRLPGRRPVERLKHLGLLSGE